VPEEEAVRMNLNAGWNTRGGRRTLCLDCAAMILRRRRIYWWITVCAVVLAVAMIVAAKLLS
jgi:hypothetical protein